MNLTELYEKVPSQHHDRISVIGDEVIIHMPQRVLTFTLLNVGAEGGKLILKSNTELTPELISSLQELGLYP